MIPFANLWFLFVLLLFFLLWVVLFPLLFPAMFYIPFTQWIKRFASTAYSINLLYLYAFTVCYVQYHVTSKLSHHWTCVRQFGPSVSSSSSFWTKLIYVCLSTCNGHACFYSGCFERRCLVQWSRLSTFLFYQPYITPISRWMVLLTHIVTRYC